MGNSGQLERLNVSKFPEQTFRSLLLTIANSTARENVCVEPDPAGRGFAESRLGTHHRHGPRLRAGSRGAGLW
jgi:hypothetical protein